MKLYLCGPMTHRPRFNYPLFDKVGAELRAMGFEVISPSEIDDPATRAKAIASPDGAPGSGAANGETWGDFLARDLKLIADGGVDGIVVLPEWEKSRGARQEVFTALNLGIPVYTLAGGHTTRGSLGYGILRLTDEYLSRVLHNSIKERK